MFLVFSFFFSSRRRHTRCALVTGVQTCALPISFGLHNDAAVLPVGPGERLVATVDTMIAGRHFLDCPPDLVARKLLRVNLSDLAAMGARPFGYLLASAWPLAIEEAWIDAFAEGLAQDQARYDIALYGRDTTPAPGQQHTTQTTLGQNHRTSSTP